LSDDQQLAIMREIVNREDTDYSRAYGAIKENNQLMVWYAALQDTVVGMPLGERLPKHLIMSLLKIEALNFDEQISMFGQLLATWAIAT